MTPPEIEYTWYEWDFDEGRGELIYDTHIARRVMNKEEIKQYKKYQHHLVLFGILSLVSFAIAFFFGTQMIQVSHLFFYKTVYWGPFEASPRNIMVYDGVFCIIAIAIVLANILIICNILTARKRLLTETVDGFEAERHRMTKTYQAALTQSTQWDKQHPTEVAIKELKTELTKLRHSNDKNAAALGAIMFLNGQMRK